MLPPPADPPADSLERQTPRTADAGAVKRPGEQRAATAEKRSGDARPPVADEQQPAVEAGEQPPVARREWSVAFLPTDDVLWLDDTPMDDLTSADEGDGGTESRPWRRGLRG